MRIRAGLSVSVTLAMWLASLEHAGAQPLDDDATTRERWGCLAEIRPAITELDPAEHPMAVACARVGGLRIGGSVELIAFDEGGDEGNHRDGDDVRLHVVTPDADRVFTLDAERQRFRQPSRPAARTDLGREQGRRRLLRGGRDERHRRSAARARRRLGGTRRLRSA